jgi:hypothetical protein
MIAATARLARAPRATAGRPARAGDFRRGGTTMKRSACWLLAAVPVLASAHHGWSEYDQTRTLTLEGQVTEMGYEHPHGYVRLATPGKTWIAVLAPPSRMDNRGLSKEMLKPGTRVTVIGYPNRGKPDEMRAERIDVGGKTVELR